MSTVKLLLCNHLVGITLRSVFDLFRFISVSSHYIGYIMTGSFKGRGNQYILVGQDWALKTAGHQ